MFRSMRKKLFFSIFYIQHPTFNTQHLLKNILVIHFPISYICPVIGSRNCGIKREIRCKSGAIPVAVSSGEWSRVNGEWSMVNKISSRSFNLNIHHSPLPIHHSPVQSTYHCRIIINDGKVLNCRASQKTCQVQFNHSGFRVKGIECKMVRRHFIFSIVFIFPKAHSLTLFSLENN
jgi:hypothetical protein